MGGFTLREMIIHGWPVLTVLLVMSILSVTTIWDRVVTLRRARMDATRFVHDICRLIDERGLPSALAYCEQFRKPVSAVIASVLLQSGGREARERALQHALQGQIRRLELYVPVLGTIGSTAPFVGLFGTVVGIIKAFQDISVNIGGGPEVVAAGIAEALITTAFGLLVAIPAVIGYNYCVHQVRMITDEIDLAAYDVIEKLESVRR